MAAARHRHARAIHWPLSAASRCCYFRGEHVRAHHVRQRPRSGRVWLGLNDAATEGTFVYSSGEPFVYSNWEPGEPNNAGNEDYVAMYSGNGRWVDVADVANPPGIGNIYGVVEVE